MAAAIAALKLKHAEHILEVVRGAEKQEAVRQEKLRHAKTKENLAYLQKRFAAERRKDQRHISGLVHDANAVEAALLRVPLSESRRRARPFGARGDGDSCRGGGGSSMGATETNGSSKSNAYVEPEPQEDPSFISLDQMRFMKYVYAHVDGEKLVKAHTRLMTQLVGAEKSDRKLQARNRRRNGSSSGKEPCPRIETSSRVEVSMAEALAKAGRSNPAIVSARGKKTAGRGRGAIARQVQEGYEHSSHRQRLLEQKRNILLEMKGVVGRQAEALDRLMESSANQSRGNGCYSNSRRTSSFQQSDGGSTKSSSLLPGGVKSDRKSFGAGSTASGQKRRGRSFLDIPDRMPKSSPVMLPVTSSKFEATLPLPPPKPPQNDTSAFLARGGRWGEGIRQGAPRPNSLSSPSSASYATFCNRGSDAGRAELGKTQRPRIVPALKV